MYSGKYGLGARLFINKKEFEYLKVTKERVRKYLKLEKDKSVSGKHSLAIFEKEYLSLLSATKRQVYVNGSVKVAIVIHSYSDSLIRITCLHTITDSLIYF